MVERCYRMNDLSEQKCEPCSGDIPPMEKDEWSEMKDELEDGWKVVNGHHLEREFKFNDFEEALEFVNRVGEIAEKEGHHPNICFTWGQARIKIFTHKIDGLHENDFILASKIEEIDRG